MSKVAASQLNILYLLGVVGPAAKVVISGPAKCKEPHLHRDRRGLPLEALMARPANVLDHLVECFPEVAQGPELCNKCPNRTMGSD